ncbi:hypothetical protein [Olleya sp. HaHaR_3_96]|uniref:hypothetical protein n=1 Tax=Olleya sp. HaHaR_3_96 TaxID=2745560 RepID=UPI001C4EFB1D|nr:hypothetical protein [Olleya sp. HaHaR_3_96]QXP59447.1 hypothetical protein H0I26_16245 [Olleya sp. HaHaR_3_96]
MTKKIYITLIYSIFIISLYSCKTTKQKNNSIQTVRLDNSLGIDLDHFNTTFLIDKSIVNTINQDLLFKDFAPSYYLHKESIFFIPKNIKRIRTKTKNDFNDYFFDTKGRLDSLHTDRHGSYKVIYKKSNGLIDYIKHSIKHGRTINKSYIVYFATDKNSIIKYETDNLDKKLSIEDLRIQFIHTAKGEIIKANNKQFGKNYIEYYTFKRNKSIIKLIKVQAGSYFFIKGYEFNKKGLITNHFFTNNDLDLKSNTINLEAIKIDLHPKLKPEYNNKGSLLSLTNKDIIHTFDYY